MMQPMSRPPSLSRLSLVPLSVACASLLVLAPSPAHAIGGGDDCEVTGCGGNTPVLFGSPIIGLALDSSPNNRGIVLDPVMERVAPPVVSGSCPDGAVLDVQSGELIGRWGTGTTCQREGLIGMALSLWVPKAPCGELPGTTNPTSCGRKARVRVRIDAVSSVPTWAVQGNQQVITYQIVWHELPAEGGFSETLVVGESICPLREAWMEEWQSDAAPTYASPPAGYERWKEETDQLLIVHGETYRPDARVDQGKRGPQWFNFGCVGSALAKSRLLDNHPMAAPAQWRLRQATLKMLSARYQGAKSYTSPGVPLAYFRWDGKAFYGLPTSGVDYGAQEAAWNENGAMCLSHRRTWKETALDGESPLAALAQWLAEARPEGASLGSPVIIPANPDVFALYEDKEEESLASLRDGGMPTCGNAPPVGHLWRTFPVDHTPH